MKNFRFSVRLRKRIWHPSLAGKHTLKKQTRGSLPQRFSCFFPPNLSSSSHLGPLYSFTFVAWTLKIITVSISSQFKGNICDAYKYIKRRGLLRIDSGETIDLAGRPAMGKICLKETRDRNGWFRRGRKGLRSISRAFGRGGSFNYLRVEASSYVLDLAPFLGSLWWRRIVIRDVFIGLPRTNSIPQPFFSAARAEGAQNGRGCEKGRLANVLPSPDSRSQFRCFQGASALARLAQERRTEGKAGSAKVKLMQLEDERALARDWARWRGSRRLGDGGEEERERESEREGERRVCLQKLCLRALRMRLLGFG